MTLYVVDELPSTVTLVQHETGKQRTYAYDQYDPRRHVYVVDAEVWRTVNGDMERLQVDNARLRKLAQALIMTFESPADWLRWTELKQVACELGIEVSGDA